MDIFEIGPRFGIGSDACTGIGTGGAIAIAIGAGAATGAIGDKDPKGSAAGICPKGLEDPKRLAMDPCDKGIGTCIAADAYP